MSQNKQLKIVVAGDGAVGKSSYVQALVTNEIYEDYVATIGVKVTKYTYTFEGEPIDILFWDVAGQEKFGGLREGYYIQADAAILMFDLTSRITYKNIPTWYSSLSKHTKNFILIGNKCDMEAKIQQESILFHRKTNMGYRNVSVKTGYQLDESLNALLRSIKENGGLKTKTSVPFGNPTTTASSTPFTFGALAKPTSPSPSTPFTFGNATPTSPLPSTSFTFGSVTPISPTAAYTFGNVIPTSTPPSTSTPFTFGNVIPTTTASSTPFTFGALAKPTSPSTPFTFGNATPPSFGNPTPAFTQNANDNNKIRNAVEFGIKVQNFCSTPEKYHQFLGYLEQYHRNPSESNQLKSNMLSFFHGHSDLLQEFHQYKIFKYLPMESQSYNNESKELLKQQDESIEEISPQSKIKFSDFPTSIRFILTSEICERYSFYAVRSIFVIFLIEFQGYGEDLSTTILHTFNAFAYFFPLLGSYLADSKLGKYKVLLYFGCIYSLGCVFLTLASIDGVTGDEPGGRSPWAIVLGLGLLALGTGGIKPCVSTFIGDQLGSDKNHLLERLFQMFYWCVNLGSLFSTILSPIIHRYISYWVAFLTPAFLLVSSTVILWAGNKRYIKRPPTDSLLVKLVGVVYTAIREKIRLRKSINPDSKPQHWLDYAKVEYDSALVDSFKTAFKVLVVFIPLPLFWSLYDQSSSRWLLQAREMKLIFGKFEIQSDQIQSLNPLIVMFLIPLVEYFVYRPLRNRNIDFKPLAKMTVGMFLTALSFVVSLLLQLWIDRSEPNSIPVFVQIPQYLIIAIAEVLISIPGLEFSYSEAPSSMKSIIMSGWLLTVSLGNIFVVLVVSGINFSEQWHEFLFFASCMFFFACIFIVIAKRYKPTDSTIANYTEPEDSSQQLEYDNNLEFNNQIILNTPPKNRYHKLTSQQED
ncbi:Peptide transporter PepT1 [Tieghemostelium lacteum]|uniref:Peptide transporter PepT1 n=1 Tax=Tieghemostelium lacteum TaxID=361077 RepID=A0A152A3R2_TIELA|nr:Peptide transporter PepT1 [Tieghemostelium lacteum]|eukprot:KYR00681.1 Peptide transporter PepT1 [Tieghemostelium lacteum]